MTLRPVSLHEEDSSSTFSSSTSSIELANAEGADLARPPRSRPTVHPATGIPPEDRQLIEELRAAVRDELTEYYDTDFNLLRWIQGNRDMPIEEVAKKLRHHMKIRKSSWQLDKVARKPRNHAVHEYWVHGITGVSKKHNTIVHVEQNGLLDYWGIRESFSVQQVLRSRTKDFEDMLSEVMKLEAKTGRQASVLFINDMAGLEFDPRHIQMARCELRSITEYMLNNYVDLIGDFVIVNAPTFIHVLWSIVKAFMPERCINKMHFLSSDKWREEILEFADPEVLPAAWNLPGSNLFKAQLEPICRVPTENYQILRNKEHFTGSGIECWRVAAGKSIFVTRPVKGGETLEWFLTADGDFGYGIYFTRDKSEENVNQMRIVNPTIRWLTAGPNGIPNSDRAIADEDGFFKLWLCNEHAWWSTLNVYGRLRILGADDDVLE